MAKSEASQRARAIYERLMILSRDVDLSNNEWAKKAGVNTSFFTNLKNGSEPSVGNLRAVLNAIDVTLPEFFVDEAFGRLSRIPSTEELNQAIADALPGLPKSQDKRARYLAEVVLAYLRTPELLPPKLHLSAEVDEEGASIRVATK